jgi:hypothetical protein
LTSITRSTFMQMQKSRQAFSSLDDSMNLPQPVLNVDCLGFKISPACGNSFSPADCPTDFKHFRQLQRPVSPPALNRGCLKLQSSTTYNCGRIRAARSTALSPGTYSMLSCSDDSSTIDPSTTVGDFSTCVPSAETPSSECAAFSNAMT